ncbi:glycosyltransferase family 4 protein [Rhodospirillum rubrum]|uniref:Glycosyl transferase, group 1 n=1 Tax=Rhodospirillum rubrum (strain ATCC 11170 / ATH 1.1.1 / DSM 467 / LMG 4362 / NCIMB 8255 / S1) TaxID=269796 RepID=Q2RPQ4_RHORT|nr:glycosyltransferase family 4 protein [Rhodospirillum rubrum]ABC23891.1 Glycosyl transferase, group 1 [Rhodospirillum rubrum ATCC 11170]AEO49635.1 glycosyl transferase, group 1 [Rhodospirillum rubrum F11]MBK5955567.1 glycosyl transferase family 1 [Rhodospirillum rubrum]QXG79837.1 glycosyltransferase family 4 protein [Rhodospirillum rubrum]HAP99164.1 glycosyltransferase family 4 protein [Rhodospirillum rubrum]
MPSTRRPAAEKTPALRPAERGDRARPLRVLVFSTLYPNAIHPHHGVFVENRLRALIDRGGFEAQVIAPVPWFPSTHPRWGAYADYAAVPRREVRHGIPVFHPRYPVLPKIGMTLAPLLMAGALWPGMERLLAEGPAPDVIDAHYAYPDGVAAAVLARRLNKPLVITARGTDISVIPQYRLPRRMIVWAAGQAAAMVAVCKALKDEMVAIGIAEGAITVLRNGVDLGVFQPLDRAQARRSLDLAEEGPLIASVGHLIERKGHHLVIEALAALIKGPLPTLRLVIAGEGPERDRLEDLAKDLGVAARVRFLGRVPHEGLSAVYSAADALVLASSREGWANVLLESMACGTPVVASNIWGTPEVVTTPAAGVLLKERSAEAIAQSVAGLLAAPPPRVATRAYAERFSWDETASGLAALFSRVSGRPVPVSGQPAVSPARVGS